jgi:hypothetical protein
MARHSLGFLQLRSSSHISHSGLGRPGPAGCDLRVCGTVLRNLGWDMSDLMDREHACGGLMDPCVLTVERQWSGATC